MSDDTSIDLLVFQIIAEREHGALVATHEPSALESTQEVTLCTFDEISEIWFDDKDINQALVLVQPRRFFIQKMLTQHHSNCQSFSIYLTLPDYLSEFEVPVKVHDLFGELYGYIQSVQAVQSIQISDKISQGITIFCIQVDLSFKRSQFDLLVHTEPGVMDLVLPRQEVYELGIIEELRKSQHIYKMDVGKRNGCFRINLPDDVVSIRIYCSSSSLEVQKTIFGSLQPIFDAIKYTAVKECQIKNCTPWNDDDFIIANGHSATISAIDLRSFQDEDISEVMNILVQLRIFFYFMSGKRLVVYGNGSNLVRLRLELLPFNVHLPIGQKQGASQFTLKKLSLPTHNETRFAVKIGRVGSFHTVPVQIAIAELAEDLESGNLYESQSVKCLREQFQAQEFHIQWIESGTSNEKCLCFELDKEYEDRIPLSVDTGISLTRITHRGPCSQPIRVGIVNKPSENRHDHWNTVFKKMSNKGDHRKNHLAFSKHSSGSIQRYNAIKSFSLDENFRRTTLIIGNEEAPFFFSDKVQVSHLGSLFDIENKVLSNWNDRSSLEYAKWDTKDRVELDVLTHSKNFYRIAQFFCQADKNLTLPDPYRKMESGLLDMRTNWFSALLKDVTLPLYALPTLTIHRSFMAKLTMTALLLGSWNTFLGHRLQPRMLLLTSLSLKICWIPRVMNNQWATMTMFKEARLASMPLSLMIRTWRNILLAWINLPPSFLTRKKSQKPFLNRVMFANKVTILKMLIWLNPVSWTMLC